MLFDHDHGKVPSDFGEQRVDWLVAMGYGAIGGAVVEAVVSSDRVLAWNAARHQAMARRTVTGIPELSAYVDPLSDVAAGLTRILLGAVAGLIFHTQVTGAYAAIAVGCSAPTVLRQLGSARLGSAFEVRGGPGESGARLEGERSFEHGAQHGLESQPSFEHEAEHGSPLSFDHEAERGPGPQSSFDHEAEHGSLPSFDHEAERESQPSFDHETEHKPEPEPEPEPERQPANPPAPPRPATAEDQA